VKCILVIRIEYVSMFYGTVVQYDTRIVVIRIVYLSIFKVRF